MIFSQSSDASRINITLVHTKLPMMWYCVWRKNINKKMEKKALFWAWGVKSSNVPENLTPNSPLERFFLHFWSANPASQAATHVQRPIHEQTPLRIRVVEHYTCHPRPFGPWARGAECALRAFFYSLLANSSTFFRKKILLGGSKKYNMIVEEQAHL